MHKSIPLAVIALFLIASPSIMFGTSNSNLFSKAMAIEQDGSKTDIKSFIKSDEVKDQGTSDGDRDRTIFIKSDEVKDEGTSDEDESSKSSDSDEDTSSKTSDSDEDTSSKTSFIKSDEVKDEGTSDEDTSSKSSDSTDNFQGQQV